jgi:hypothetical protein
MTAGSRLRYLKRRVVTRTCYCSSTVPFKTLSRYLHWQKRAYFMAINFIWDTTSKWDGVVWYKFADISVDHSVSIFRIMKMRAACSSRRSVNFYQTARRYILEVSKSLLINSCYILQYTKRLWNPRLKFLRNVRKFLPDYASYLGGHWVHFGEFLRNVMYCTIEILQRMELPGCSNHWFMFTWFVAHLTELLVAQTLSRRMMEW